MHQLSSSPHPAVSPTPFKAQPRTQSMRSVAGTGQFFCFLFQISTPTHFHSLLILLHHINYAPLSPYNYSSRILSFTPPPPHTLEWWDAVLRLVCALLLLYPQLTFNRVAIGNFLFNYPFYSPPPQARRRSTRHLRRQRSNDHTHINNLWWCLNGPKPPPPSKCSPQPGQLRFGCGWQRSFRADEEAAT